MWAEFKAFLLKTNALALAIGVAVDASKCRACASAI
jgi:large-conductance mechanosensitive channel